MSVTQLPVDCHALAEGPVRERRGAPPCAARTRLGLGLVGLDVVSAVVGLLAAGGHPPVALVVGPATLVAANRAQGLYQSFTSSMRVFTYAALVRSAALVAVATHLLRASDRQRPGSTSSIAVFACVLVLAVGGHYGFEIWLRGRRLAGDFLRRTVVIGGGPEALQIARLLLDNPALGYDVVGRIGPGSTAAGPVPWLGELHDTGTAIPAAGASGAVVSPSGLAPEDVRALIRTLESMGTHVHVTSGVEGIDCRRLRSVDVAHHPFLYVEPPTLGWPQQAAKRAVDIVLASIGLLAATPLLVAAAIAIKLEDGGPVLFRQDRAGRDGTPFRLHKLRTMEVEAESHLSELAARNERAGPLFKIDDDPRVTRVGRFLRRSSIDELPQLLDVLLGRMSLVGPRPALPAEVAQFDTELLDRLRVKPGITGLWQVEARDEADFDAYRRLDLFYVENWSVLLDLLILADTVPAVLGRAIGSLRPRPRAERSGAVGELEPQEASV